MVLKTPAATIGIRGTAGAGDVADGGATRATLLEERGQPVGELVFNNDGGTQVVNVLGALVTVASFAAAPRVTPITVQAVGQQFGRAIVFLPNADRHLPDTLRNTVRQILDGRDDGAPGLNPADTGQADVDQSAASTSDSDPRDGDQSDTGQSDAGDGGTGLGGSRVVAALQDGVAPNTATGVDKAAVASLLGAEGAGKSTLLSEVVHVTKLDVLQAVADKIADLRPTAKVDELVEAKNPFANLERGNSGLLSDTAKEAEKVNEVIQEQNSKTDSSVVDVAELVRAATTKILEAKEADRETGIEDSIGLGKNTGSTVNGTGHADVLKGTSGTDIINGGAGNDDIQGGAGNDLLNGGAGNDTLDGGADNDVIHGDAGNDIIIGGLGSDTLFGGPNHDTFRMNSPLEGADYLADFQPGTDTLALLASAFNNPSFFTTSTYPAGNAGSGSGAPSVILYDGTGAVASQVVFYDQDGMNTGYSVVPLAVLPSGTTITLSDITLV
ncbi:MAG: hypothetical protein H6907_01740 [Hyphomicrobiales bacterium]|nr:hypothetical protein [Hyphomicrobiales bacterium]MCP5370427.1 hypothetical protein [Hyphomicrobiales bacterium]